MDPIGWIHTGWYEAVRLRLNLSNIFLQGKLEIIIYPRTNCKIVILSSYDSSLYKNLALNRELVKIVREYQCRSLLVITEILSTTPPIQNLLNNRLAKDFFLILLNLVIEVFEQFRVCLNSTFWIFWPLHINLNQVE